ncbi:protein BOLA2 [Canna indica]|uniref:Protein BOLA2 n=1 Tax=Canna indica TaxID=4628 RepID=A0AAQ3QBB8_9LILI|nr:protein BOLA2 [Canna indica]
MGVTKEEVETVLNSSLKPSHLVTLNASSVLFFFDLLLEKKIRTLTIFSLSCSPQSVIDTSGGCGASFEVEIVSAEFEGKRLLERHRLVNTALADQMKQIHALSIKKALTPAQWNPNPAATK